MKKDYRKIYTDRNWKEETKTFSRSSTSEIDSEIINLESAIKEDSLLIEKYSKRIKNIEKKYDKIWFKADQKLSSELKKKFSGEEIQKDDLSRNKFYLKLSIEYYGNAIAELKRYRKKAKKRERNARLASYDKKSRDIGSSIVKEIRSEAEETFICPYCNQNSNKDDSHVDHIYPVSKGGLTVKTNMVLVCDSCNLNKRDLTLYGFARKFDLDLDDIITKLEKLGKNP